MIKFISPEPNGGMPFEIEDLLQLQDGLYTGLSFLCNAVGTPFILSGCDVVSSTATTCVITSGWVWIESDFRYFPAYSGTYPFYIVKDASAYYTKTFENGTVQNALVDAFAKAVTSVTPGQQSIAMNPSNAELRYKATMTSEVTAGLATEVTNRSAAIADLLTKLAAINQVLPTKATKLVTAIPWMDIATTDDGYSVAAQSTKKAQYRLDEFGTVHLRGTIQNNKNINGLNLVTLNVATLPTAILPTQDMRFLPAITYSTKYYLDGSTTAQTQYGNGGTVNEYNSAQVTIYGKENSTIQTGAIIVYTKFPISDSLYISLEGISWSIIS